MAVRPCRTTPCSVNLDTNFHSPPTIVAVVVSVIFTFYRQFPLYYNQVNQLPRGLSPGGTHFFGAHSEYDRRLASAGEKYVASAMTMIKSLFDAVTVHRPRRTCSLVSAGSVAAYAPPVPIAPHRPVVLVEVTWCFSASTFPTRAFHTKLTTIS